MTEKGISDIMRATPTKEILVTIDSCSACKG